MTDSWTFHSEIDGRSVTFNETSSDEKRIVTVTMPIMPNTTLTWTFSNREMIQDLKAVCGLDPYEELYRILLAETFYKLKLLMNTKFKPGEKAPLDKFVATRTKGSDE